MRVERIGGATLYLGDCLEVLRGVEGVDHVIMDPPYEEEAHTLQRRASRGALRGSGNEIMSVEQLNFPAIDEVMRARVCRFAASLSSGWILAFCQAEAIAAWRQAMIEADARWRRACVWIKPDGMPQYSGDRPGMGYESIACAWAGEGKSAWNGGGRHGVYRINKGEKIRWGHQTQKPLLLMERLVVDFTNADESVLDPFMGSGTTGVACANLGRKFIGIEIEERYFDIACERIQAAYAQLRLFA